ncbi:MASE4 domain-containing protein [Bradyrhizobium canariense]|uniref:histidine kinase n=1 Tax=Bradyrhizobium canariense TaxID=255045 RepID=A0A1X3FHY6_9BRAD|nr:MASE4 domain-containing protein [Bradyrhizobium canariense]OSI33158.1 two-component sensor histidine kinase [Bradyrhizobium canariense]OSI36984.1 two-component sensor histidine kinase [Bradyrhizobium canariense]OSI54170.1 two-component sensor histidine kinase [Bradyrhizobium canariense]OSI56050.1 two-component sensor histidine kinase [Bradyrhizobium canariense]OSI59155.1 two-component sensor histidine kinase [Bradyrhizobium canariense]
MSQRKFMGLVGGATASGPGIALASQRSANAAAEPAYDDEQEFPLIIANIPATPRQKAWAVGVAVLLIVLAAVIAPFARIQLGQINGFVPVLQTALALAEFITAALLFAQFSIQPQQALLALASGYVFSGSFAFLQTLAFPNGYASAGVIGDGLNSPAWLYVLWHTTFPAAILGYGFTKDQSTAGRPSRPAIAAIATAIGCIATVAGLTWMVTAKAEFLPSFYVNDVRHQTPLGNQVNLILLLWNMTALTVLFVRMRTILDLWLMVTLLAYLPNFLVAIIGSSVRFTIGWYAARGFVLVGSCMLLTVLLIETIYIYSRLASVTALQRRERANRLLSIDAVTGALAHELRSPLGAISLNAATGLSHLRAASPELEDLENILCDIEADGNRAADIISTIREMTIKTAHGGASTNVEDVAELALRLLKHDLQANGVSVATEFQGNIPPAAMDGTELQQIVLNLCKNAIDAMSSVPANQRQLRIKTRLDDGTTVYLSVEDSGTGVSPGDQERIFDPFFTTKQEGMGLGLAISSNLAARCGGKLRLVKSAVKGSVFELAMPISGPASAQ